MKNKAAQTNPILRMGLQPGQSLGANGEVKALKPLPDHIPTLSTTCGAMPPVFGSDANANRDSYRPNG